MTSGGTAAETLQQRRQVFGLCRPRVDGDGLLGLPLALLVAPPGEDRSLQVGGIDHNAAEPVSLLAGSCAGRISSAIW